MIKKIYNRIFSRYDEVPYFKYFGLKDFPGLMSEEYSFMSFNNTLRGFFYHYDNYDEDTIVIFCHGIGGGHSSYFKEIEKLAKAGFNVLGFDYTGCVLSEGDTSNGLSNSLRDLDMCIKSLRCKDEYKDKKIYVVGHSWGAYAAGAINLYERVDKVVSIAPFISPKVMYNCFFKFPFFFLTPLGMALEKSHLGGYAYASVLDALNIQGVKALVLASFDDSVIPFKKNTKKLIYKVKNNNVKFLISEGKNHFPHYSYDAVNYFIEVNTTYKKKLKDKTIKTNEDKAEYYSHVDFDRCSAQDEHTWRDIIKFLKYE